MANLPTLCGRRVCKIRRGRVRHAGRTAKVGLPQRAGTLRWLLHVGGQGYFKGRGWNFLRCRGAALVVSTAAWRLCVGAGLLAISQGGIAGKPAPTGAV